MNRKTYEQVETYMRDCLHDSAHDKEHIYRVLYLALDIAQHELGVDYDILIASCMLHDIGRAEEYKNAKNRHEKIGADMAYDFLIKLGWPEEKAKLVKACIRTHRFRSDNPPVSLEAKILFDADKLEVTGLMGIARSLLHQGRKGEPLHTVDEYGQPLDGTDDQKPSFLQEYKYKLEKLYTRFYTQRATELAKERQPAAAAFYDTLLAEIRASYSGGPERLDAVLK